MENQSPNAAERGGQTSPRPPGGSRPRRIPRGGSIFSISRERFGRGESGPPREAGSDDARATGALGEPVTSYGQPVVVQSLPVPFWALFVTAASFSMRAMIAST